jgi:aminoglycoside 3-N-acetyltransferase
MAGHELACHLGEASPLGRLYRENASILLLGVGFAACTALHLAEYRYRPDPPLRSYRCVVVRHGRPQWCEYEDVVLDDRDLPAIGAELDRAGLVRRGQVGFADCRLMRMRDAVDFASERLGQYRTR